MSYLALCGSCSKERARARARRRRRRAGGGPRGRAVCGYGLSSLALLSLSERGVVSGRHRVGTTRKYNITNCNAATKQSPNSRRAGTALGRLGEGRSANTSEQDSHAHRSEKQLRWRQGKAERAAWARCAGRARGEDVALSPWRAGPPGALPIDLAPPPLGHLAGRSHRAAAHTARCPPPGLARGCCSLTPARPHPCPAAQLPAPQLWRAGCIVPLGRGGLAAPTAKGEGRRHKGAPHQRHSRARRRPAPALPSGGRGGFG